MLRRTPIGVLAVAGLLNAAACSSSTETGSDREPPRSAHRQSDADTSGPESGPEKSVEAPRQALEGSLVIDVNGPLGRVDRDYAFDIRKRDTTARTRLYHVASGQLPPGIVLTEDGSLSGKPTTPGHHEAIVHGEGECGAATCRLEVHLDISVPEVILLSGFGPFDGVPVNPSWQAVEPLDGVMIGGYDVRVIQVPVIWDEALPRYFEAYDRLRPAIAIASGVARGGTGIRIETTARNYAAGTDIAGASWATGPIDPSAPSTYDSTLPVDRLIDVLGNASHATMLSDNAGDYLCNFLFFGLMRKVAAEDSGRRVIAGFVHVPPADVISPAETTEAWKLMLSRLAEDRSQGVAANGPARVARARIPVVHEAPRYWAR
ncbi:MAG: pyroglutamyl-peptidase I [Labilithrix sp.]|nr:pyroglutamyl-peptidase I [Labilithrix sp.]